MPNSYIENSQRWLDLSEVDYLGHFVKAWLAFNAWYRNAYTHASDRAFIDDLKWQPTSPMRSKLVPLLSSSTEEAVQFKSLISDLHYKLENYHIYSGKGAEKERITLTQVYLNPNRVTSQNGSRSKILYQVAWRKVENQRCVTCIMTNRKGDRIFCLDQQKYGLVTLENDQGFKEKLSVSQKDYMRELYRRVNPKIVVDLTNLGRIPPIQVGSYRFTCTPEELFAGICEVLYLMRNTLFHGELVPSRPATECYEPAYHIVRKFLLSIE